MKKPRLIIYTLILLFFSLKMISGYQLKTGAKPEKKHDFKFNSIPAKWDEGLPLGNGMLGALIWQKGNTLRFALDRADLWDLRLPKEFESPNYRFSWVVEQVKKKDYKPVQDLLDVPYDRDATPTKIPAGAVEFDIPGINDIEYANLQLRNAVSEIKWKNGIILTSFVNAASSNGWIKIDGLQKEIIPRISPPPFKSEKAAGAANSGAEGNDLVRLGYPEPEIKQTENEIIYTQKCYGDFEFKIHVSWKYINKTLFCSWTITTNKPYPLYKDNPVIDPKNITTKKYSNDLNAHISWWNNFWNKSSVQIPDSLLETQWYREIYKLGSASRKGAPPITLQAVWTADNRRLPPWKGDFHNDLNTQLSYWPSYSSNHLEEAEVFLDWILLNKTKALNYTKKYFGVDGINFPGVLTLTGDPMGGWIQYALSPTVSAWLAQHFYLQWRYSMDKTFLRNKAYPWIKETARFITNLSILENGKRRLPLSSSPEINDNDITAWFKETTNFDLSLIRWLYNAAAETALALNQKKDAGEWNKLLSEWPELAVANDKLLVAPGYELKETHRHFSHLMSIHPLGLLDWRNEKERNIIKTSLNDLERLGTDYWCGYSYSWLGSMYARSMDGDKAAGALRTFASCFCSPNSFHLNGDQSKTGKSKFTYRPFTLEGNFAFAEGIQQMLLQSHNNLIIIFPAVPDTWKDISFNNLRAEGAFIISAEKKNGNIKSINIMPEKGGLVKIQNPFNHSNITVSGLFKTKSVSNDYIEIETIKGNIISIANK